MNWARQRTNIQEANFKTSRKRVPTTTKRALYPEMEKALLEWIKDNRERGVCISGFAIKVKAFEIMRENSDNNNSPFRASDGWLSNFLKRKNLTLRRISSTGRDLAQNTRAVLKEFFDNCKNLFTNVNRAQIINMDEIGVYLDCPSNYTYDSRGILDI